MGGVCGRSNDVVWCKNGFRMYKVKNAVNTLNFHTHNNIIHVYTHNCSGHGLSGMALLSLPAFLAVSSMFAGGMGLAYVLNILH